ncbi:MAG TPA: DUF222 domain-containing protein [Actinomycetota bacterium]|nr:DUF222 domain-containing protein [Actinomycetota bacterium]
MDTASAALSVASAKLLRAVAEYDDRRLWLRDGAGSMTSWLSGRYGLRKGSARELVRVARRLRRLPEIARAHAEGRLSWDQLQPLTRFATAETDGHWAARAPSLRPGALWREAARHERMRIRDANDAHRSRSLRLYRDPDRPVVYVDGSLPPEQGAAVEAALNRRAEEVPRDPEADFPDEARMADAFVELVTGSADRQPGPATLVVHADVDAVTGQESREGPWLTETEDGYRLTAEAVRRLACDAVLEWVLEERGRPVGIGRRGRAVPGHLLRAVRHRDGASCRFPGCERRKWLNAHHLVHWADGGPTTLDNLLLLCWYHHRLIHERGWGITGHPATDLRFHDPTGRALRTHPVRPPP